jgi:signal transduction histidine kinase
MRRIWNRLNLAQQFAVIALGTIVCAMVILATWIAEEIQNSVLHNTIESRAFYIEGTLAPLVQELKDGDELKPESQKSISALLKETPLGLRISKIKIWNLSGKVVYSTDPNIVGETFPISPGLQKAIGGVVSFEFERGHGEAGDERTTDAAQFEIYAPVRENRTGRIVAVAELYELADNFRADLDLARLKAWLMVGSTTTITAIALFVIVWRGSRTIEDQQKSLVMRIHELSRLLVENLELQKNLRMVSASATRNNERFLRQVSADLHDGAAQLIGLALLRLDNLKTDEHETQAFEVEIENIRNSLQDALVEIRALSAGVAPPNLQSVSPREAIMSAINMHERRTGTSVKCEIGNLPSNLPPLLQTCLYRFVQEGLNNAYRHAEGKGQAVRAICECDEFVIEVSDTGCGTVRKEGASDKSLGLAGLRARVESLDGRFEWISSPGHGTRVIARFGARQLQGNHEDAQQSDKSGQDHDRYH